MKYPLKKCILEVICKVLHDFETCYGLSTAEFKEV